MNATPLEDFKQAVAIRRDARRVERMLREYAEPPKRKALDVEQVRSEMLKQLDGITPSRANEEFYSAIDGYVDAYMAEYLLPLRERHHRRLGRLDLLAAKAQAHRTRIRGILNDQEMQLHTLDEVVENLKQFAAKPDEPIRTLAAARRRSTAAAAATDGGAGAAADPGPSRTRRGGLGEGVVVTGYLGDVVHRWWAQAALWIVVGLAAFVDVGTFYQVMVYVLPEPPRVVWTVVVGFASVALALAHLGGSQARQTADLRRDRRAAAVSGIFFSLWLTLGLLALIIRYELGQGGDSSGGYFPGSSAGASGSSSQHYEAWFLFVLYLATGAVTAAAGYLRPDRAARQLLRAEKLRGVSARRNARTAGRHTQLEQTLSTLDDVRRRSEEAWTAAQEQCRLAAARLKQEVRLYFARYVAPMSAAPAPATTPRHATDGSSAAEAPPSGLISVHHDPADLAAVPMDPEKDPS